MPITFGLRAAQWLAGIEDARRGLESAAEQAILLQFGGAVGTRAGLDGKGQDIAASAGGCAGPESASRAVAQPPRKCCSSSPPALGILIGSLGKIGRDISLLAQNAIGELREPAIEGRGGSSVMPHKRNPVGCQVALSAALRAPGLVATVLSGLPQELERGLGGWQAEGPVLADLFMLAGGSADAMAAVLEGLEVNADAMASNLAAADVGDDVGEAASIIERIVGQHRKDA